MSGELSPDKVSKQLIYYACMHSNSHKESQAPIESSRSIETLIIIFIKCCT